MDFVYRPPAGPLNILFRDQGLLVVNKPAGLLSVPGRAPEHRDSLESRVRAEFPAALLVHRLDMDTSGLMVFALDKDVQRALGRQFELRQVDKAYVALVSGDLQPDNGRVDLPLIVDWPNRPLQMVDHEQGKPAQTDWQVLARLQGNTRVSLHPKTGRSHQLRVHMQALGHPIIGDRFYAPPEAVAQSDRLLLHAKHLCLNHPQTGVRLHFSCPCPF
jgi:tRNA pseudouridine32 synthase/23S rRNA pseudouridine746 synthase